MASAINPNNINGNYPIAGQDNPSQGMRDNFTNIKNNFQYAEDEITDLQNKVLLKAALAGTTLDNDMTGALVYDGVIRGFGATRVAIGTVGGSVLINYSLGHYQTLTTSASISLGFSNFPAAGVTGVLSLQVTVSNTTHTMTLPAAVSVNNVGVIGINPSTNVITFPATGVYVFQFITSDGGATITVNQMNTRLQSLNSSSEDLANGAIVSLATAASYFTTASAETATLPAGVPGQVKVLNAVDVAAGNMVITVANPAWGGSGTITFANAGVSCILQYTNNRWFCIGNNGCSFA